MRGYIRKTKWGTVKGEELPDGVIYHGIPYAKAERFAYPEMIRSWDGIFDATKPGAECCQYGQYRDESTEKDNFYYREFRRGMKFTYAESPMTLNIIAPKEAKNCPVLVFIHGGGFETGTVEEPPYGTSLEYAKRGILLVSLGYRLNVFSLYRSRNYGLHDQMMGLHWVKEYIEDFGGNPDRIVMMGQSAGAMSVMDLCYSDGLKGVVKGAIMMSGGGVMPELTAPWTQEESKEFWDRVMKRAGAADEAEMKVLPPEVLWEAWYQESREYYNLHVVQPGIDGTVIPELPSNRKRAGKILNIPMFVGITS